jgi:hypothetical protein
MVAEEKYTLQKLRLNPNVLTYQNLDMIPYDEEKSISNLLVYAQQILI